MQILSQTVHWVRQAYGQKTLDRPIVVLPIAGLCIVCFGLLFAYTMPSEPEYLFDREVFDSGTLRRMDIAFVGAGLHEHDIFKGLVTVPAGKRDAYIFALCEGKALPSNYDAILRSSAEPDSGSWATKAQRKQAVKETVRRELANIIGQMAGIEEAAVDYSIEVKPGFYREVICRATVHVKPSSDGPFDKKLVPSIVYPVLGAIGGEITPSDVFVVDTNSGDTYRAIKELQGDDESAMYDRESIVEQKYQREIKEFLGAVSDVLVAVDLKLDESPEQIERAKNEQAFQLGYEAMKSQPNPLVGSKITLQGEVDEQSVSRLAQMNQGPSDEPLPVKQVTVSIRIPRRYLVQIWHRKNPPEEGEPVEQPSKELMDQFRQDMFQDMKQQVANLLPELIGKANIVDQETRIAIQEYELWTSGLNHQFVADLESGRIYQVIRDGVDVEEVPDVEAAERLAARTEVEDTANK